MTHANDIPATDLYRDEGWASDIYPMPSFPMVVVADLAVSTRWYQQALGFADVLTLRGADERPILAHLRWCRWADVLLTQARTPSDAPAGRGITLNFATVDVDAVAERARVAGATILEGPVDRPWNARDVTIADPDGYRLNFTGRLPGAPQRSFDEIMSHARNVIREGGGPARP